MAAKLYEPLMEFREKPMEGVKLEEAYQVFGQWDFAVLFQADTNTNALHFVGDKIRLIEALLKLPPYHWRRWSCVRWFI